MLFFSWTTQNIEKLKWLFITMALTWTLCICMLGTVYAISPTLNPASIDQSDLGTRTPLILIHGIQFDIDTLEYHHVWDEFLNYYTGNSDLNSKIKPYYYAYETLTQYITGNPDTISTIGQALRSKLQERYDTGEFRDRPVIILAHSMGGLVARAMMQEYQFKDGHSGGDKVHRLITLATPHHGTPLADLSSKAETIFLGAEGKIVEDLGWDSYNGRWHAGCNLWLRGLNNDNPEGFFLPALSGPLCGLLDFNRHGYYDKIIAYAGYTSYFSASGILAPLNGTLRVEGYDYNDGLVPLESALFEGWSIFARYTVDFPCDHSQLPRGMCSVNKDGRDMLIFSAIKQDLLQAIPSMPIPMIAAVQPNTLTALPLPEAQALTINGAGFLPTSLLKFYDGFTHYGNKIPAYISSTQLRYNIAVGSDQANWTVTVLNGTVESNPFPFYVIAAPDTTAPPAPINLAVVPVSWSKSNLFYLDWTNPSDQSGIVKIWWKLGSEPTSPSDGLAYNLPLFKPLPIGVLTEGQQTIYVWLEDGSGNKNHNNRSSIILYRDTTAPNVMITNPTTSSAYTSPSATITLGGTASDHLSGISGITWINDRGGYGTIPVSGNWSSPVINLSEGINVIMVIATDAAGNSATDTIAVTYNPTGTTYTLTVGVNGSGNVTSNPTGITCPGTCQATFPSGTPVVLFAFPGAGYAFGGWTGCDTTSGPSCSVTLSGSRTATATFTAASPVPTGFRASTVSSREIDLTWEPVSGATEYRLWRRPASESYSVYFTITAPLRGYIDDIGLSPATTYYYRLQSCQSTACSDFTSEIAATTLARHTVSVSPVTNGTVTSNPAGINCPGSCSGTFDSGTSVTLTAIPASGYLLNGWGGDCAAASTAPLCTLIVTAQKSVSASFIVRPTVPGDFVWARKADMPVRRKLSAVTAVGGKVYAIGVESNRSLHEFVPATNTWSRKNDLPVLVGTDGGAATLNGKIYAVGEATDPRVAVYDPASDTASVGTALPTPRYNFGVAAVGGRIYAIGGRQGCCFSGLSVVEAYDPGTNTWVPRANMLTPRWGLGTAVINGLIYAIGGFDGDSDLNTVEVYNPAADTWSAAAPMPTPRRGLVVGVINNRAYAVGGRCDGACGQLGYLDVVEEYDPASNLWTPKGPAPTKRFLAGGAVIGNQLYVVGGFNDTGELSIVEEGTFTAGQPSIRTPIPDLLFGNVSLYDTPQGGMRIYNDGNDILTINTVVRVSGSADFTVITPTPLNILPHDSPFFVLLRFAPTSVGAKTATVRLDSNDPGKPTVTFVASGTVVAQPDVTLAVSSAYGTPSPNGTTTLVSGTTLTASISPTTVPGVSGTRYRLTGWSGTGSVPTIGIGDSVTFTISANSSLIWQWATEAQLATQAVPAGIGSIAAIPASPDSWYTLGTTVVLTAIPAVGFQVGAWTGCQSTSGDQCTVLMDQARTVSVSFIDIVPPVTTLTATPSNPSNSSSANFSFTGSDNVTPAASLSFECQPDNGGFAACTSPKSYTGLTDGSHTFQVRAKDAAGNVDASPASYAWTIDTTAPDTLVDSGPANPSNSSSASFTFHATEAGSSFECQLDASGFAACSSPKNYSGLTEGAHTFQVRAKDAAGNLDASPASYPWRIDTTPPDTLVDSGPPALSPSKDASFTFHATEAGSSFECQLDAGGYSACTSPKLYSALTEGAHTFQVRAKDAAGNLDASPASYPWTIDSTPPDTLVDSGPPVLSTSSSATFSFHATEAGSSFECQLDAGGYTACSSPKLYSALTEGAHTFQVRAKDVAGNVDASPASYPWTVDTTAPTNVRVTAPRSGQRISGTFLLKGTAQDNSGTVKRLEFYVDTDTTAVCVDATPKASGSTFQCGWDTRTKANGSHTVKAKAYDEAGNSTASTQVSFRINNDITPPTNVRVTAPRSGQRIAGTFVLKGTAKDNSGTVQMLEFYIDADSTPACADATPKPSGSTFQCSWDTRAKTNGSHTVKAKAYDAALNATLSPSLSFTIKNRATATPDDLQATPSDPSATALHTSARPTSSLGAPEQDLSPLLERQWHLQPKDQEPAAANVMGVWEVTQGADIVIGVVDDGLQHTHPDLQLNYMQTLSWDFHDNDPDPSPDTSADVHGTAVAGVAAAQGDSGLGISGVAPLAALAGLRLIGAPISDAQEASALAHELDTIQISNNAWGPADDGMTLDRPGPLALAALEAAATQGREGKGRVVTWAVGNGLEHRDNCNFDGYSNSRFVIAVGALADDVLHAPYSEPCSAVFLVAPSDGGSRGITTTDLVGGPGYDPTEYTHRFGGTGSATSVVSGVVALMLAQNPSLTWRDVKHILARSSSKEIDPTDPSWTHGPFSHSEQYGFGLIDAEAAVSLATTWNGVAAERAIPSQTHTLNLPIPDNNATGLADSITIDAEFAHFSVEHVEVEFTAAHPYRGDLEVTLTSPSGVVSRLATIRPNDAGDSFRAWRFGSVRHWGETAAGTWTLHVADLAAGDDGTGTSWTLRIFGTANDSTLPDLVVGTVSGPSRASAGAVIPVRVSVMNQGQATTASFKVGLYLAADISIDLRSDVLLGTITVPGLRADRPFSGTFPVTLPATLPPGTYYLGAIADLDGSVPESDEGNNARAGIRPIELTN